MLESMVVETFDPAIPVMGEMVGEIGTVHCSGGSGGKDGFGSNGDGNGGSGGNNNFGGSGGNDDFGGRNKRIKRIKEGTIPRTIKWTTGPVMVSDTLCPAVHILET